MVAKKKLTLKFYQNLGKLFYAIAAADKQVREVEFDKLKALIRQQWPEINDTNNRFNTDAAHQIEFVFNHLNQENAINAKKCFDDFVNFKNEQQHLFTNQVKQLILKTASAIAASFSGINKSELIMLAKLDIELKKIKSHEK
ncbi:hypothetical protein [Changchengzhania lutea]|uniref:hypothetical protein n=1 Tax=Changchengzhania lutea TaxID=2049305 RepID=UPI00115F5C56|nr:hypothetical protein [Changchengzhania lutea]